MRMIFFLFYYSFFSLPLALSQACESKQQLEHVKQLNEKGEFRKALKMLDTLLICTETNGEQENHWQSLLWKYQLLRNRRKYKKAFLVAETALDYQQKNFPSDFENLEMQLYFLEAAALAGKKEQARQYLIDLRTIFQQETVKDKSLLAYFNFIEGFYEQHISWNRDAALKAYQKALSLYLEMENPPVYYLGQSLRYMGILHQIEADYDKALVYYEQEIAAYKKQYKESHIEIANTNYNIANIHYHLLNYQNALDHYLACFEVWNRRYKPGAKYLRLLNEAIGDMYWELDNRAKALAFYERAEAYEPKQNNDESLLKTVRGDSLLQLGKYDGALSHYQEALAFRKKEFGEQHNMTGTCQNFIARAYQFAGKTDQALRAYQKSIAIFSGNSRDTSFYTNPSLDQKINAPQDLLTALMAKAFLLKERFDQLAQPKDLEMAFQTQQLCLQLIERIRQTARSTASKLFWTQQVFPLLELSIETALVLYEQTKTSTYLETAFSISEKAKTILLLSALQASEAAAFAGVPDSLLQKELTLKKAIVEREGKLALEEQRCAARRANRLDLHKEKLLFYNNEYDALLQEFKQRFPKYYALKFKMPTATTAEIRKNVLKDQESALLEFFEGAQKLYVFLIDQERFQFFRINKDEAYEKNIRLLQESLMDVEGLLQKPQEHYENFVKSSGAFFQEVLEKPLSGILGKRSRLILVPDGQLAYIPFEVLLTDSVNTEERDYKNLPYLFKTFALSYSQSASLLLQLSDAKSTTRQASNYLGFAPNYSASVAEELVFHQEEIQQAVQLFDGQNYLGAAASEKQFKLDASTASILHLAMHAKMNDEEPLLSHLLFSATDTTVEDARLHAYELYNLQLNAELVLLSACETGTGHWERGEGMMSLERAFQYAGCPSLLSSLWLVDDASTKDLILPFLENTQQKVPLDIALQQARLNYLQKADPASTAPFFWAGFRLNGNRASIEWSSSSNWKIGLGIVAFLVLLVLGIQWKRSL